MSLIVPVILCGGSGTRLWPLSRVDRPKQLISLMGDETLLEGTLRRAMTIRGASDPICVTAADYGGEVRHCLERLGLRGRLLLEPEPRNTAPALAAAALVAARSDADAIIVALPADHYIEEGKAFVASIECACAAASSEWLVVLGVKPRHASAALGYILPDKALESMPGVLTVERFVEKPTTHFAFSLIERGALWNAGVVIAKAKAIIDALRKHEPAVLDAVERSLPTDYPDSGDIHLSRAAFSRAPQLSFDKAVLERHGAVAVTTLDAMWRDVGTWGEVAELYPEDADGNRCRGRALLTSSHNSFAFSPHRLTVGIGLTDVVIIDTQDALLVANLAELGRIREVVETMGAENLPEVRAGRAATLDASSVSQTNFEIREILLGSGEVLNCLPHGDAARHWLVLEGSVETTLGEDASICFENQCVHVPPHTPLRLTGRSGTPAKLIEVLRTQPKAGTDLPFPR